MAHVIQQQTINSGGQPRPVIISGPGQPGQRYSIIRGVQQGVRPGQPGMQQTVRYRVQPGPGGHQSGIPVNAVLQPVQLRPEGPVQPQAVRHVQMRPGQIQRPVAGGPVRIQHQGVIQQTDQQQHAQYAGGQVPGVRYAQPGQQVMVAGQPGWRQHHPGHRVVAAPPHRAQVIHGQVGQVGQVIQKPVRQFVPGPAQQSNVPNTTPGQDPNIQYNIEHVFIENGKEVRKMPVMIDNNTVWVDVVDQKTEDIEGEIVEFGPGQAGMVKTNTQ